MNRLIAAISLAATATAGPSFGACDKSYSPMETFDVDSYSGLWYEISRDKYTFFEALQSCVTATYTANDDGTVGVNNQAYMPIRGWSGGKAIAVPADTGDASLIVDFSGQTPDPSQTPNYTVLDTDYETYTVVYSCSNIAKGLASFEFLWILSRTPTLDDATMISIVEKIDAKLPKYNYFRNQHQTW